MSSTTPHLHLPPPKSKLSYIFISFHFISIQVSSIPSTISIFCFSRSKTMPICKITGDESTSNGASDNAIDIFYRTYGHGPIKVLLIIGLAGTHDSWGPQIKGLTGSDIQNSDDNGGYGGIEVCAFDNRGMGRSSIPTKKSQYTTRIMANDAIAVMDHLGWEKAHIFGHSMGAMISCKLAAMVPERVLSLALLNVTGGGFECFPKLDRKTVSIAIRFLKAKTPEQRAAVDLDTHYSDEYLEEYVGSKKRRAILYQEYVKGISSTGMQSSCGFDGQINACWTHKMTRKELGRIQSAGFLVSVIHGRHDIIAQIYYARRLAEKLYPVAKMVDLHGGHLVSHERREEVNQALLDLIRAAEAKISPHEWTNLPQRKHSFLERRMLLLKRTSTEGENNMNSSYGMINKLQACFIYIFSLFVFIFEHARKAQRSLRPAKVEPSLCQ